MKSEKIDDERHVRRVQVTGRGSYIISIPKPWVKEAGLIKGGRIEFSAQQNGGLLLTPFDTLRQDEEKSKCELLLPNNAETNSVMRKIISLYVVGYSTIGISSQSGNLAPAMRDAIREVARQKLVGTEVVTESSRSATLQVLLNYPQLLVPDALRRMSSIMSSMQQDALQALAERDRELAKQVTKTDDEIDRFSLYIIRQLKWAVQHPMLVGRIGLTTPVDCLGYRIITKTIERSADHAARVAQSSLNVEKPLDPVLLKDMNAFSQYSSRMMDNALRALYTTEYELAEKVLEDKDRVSILESKLVERVLKEKMAASELLAVTLISESLRRIGEYASDVAEVVLNLAIHKSVEVTE
jgi:phosphate uptake regulator